MGKIGVAAEVEDTIAGWRRNRKSGMIAIALSGLVAAALWFGIRYGVSPIPGMELLGARMLFALKCSSFATLFCLVLGVEAVAHERLQSPAFDPLVNFETKRLRVNLRYLQNTLEQLVIFFVAIFGLTAYSPDGDSMRAVLATTIVWIAGRFAFWVGYHISAAMRGIGAPGVIVTMLALLYVVARIGFDMAGMAGAIASMAAFFAIEAFLFWTTRARP
ncbi:MAG: hypothetical protein H0W74_08810 [Sphingosinicella sp.]|nr:hypothetical protein [Sphingosinicella sp.]